LKHFERTDQKKEPRALTRYGCMARLDVERNEGSGIWFVKAFVAVHTCALAK
jgi:zinc finger SWIM domain-containing protein 3